MERKLRTLEDGVKIYYAGTGEAGDLEIIMIALAVVFGIAALIAWGIPRFRDYLHLRQEARLRVAEEAEEAHTDGLSDDTAEWHSVTTH